VDKHAPRLDLEQSSTSRKLPSPAAVRMIGYMVGSVISSVSLVTVSKVVFQRGFAFPMTSNAITYFAVVVFYRGMHCLGLFDPSSADGLPLREKLKVALAAVSAIGFMNLSLLTNPLTFYQIVKMLTIPITITINYVFYKRPTSAKVLFALAILLSGVAACSVQGAQGGVLSVAGFTYAAVAVVNTAVYRIWQGSKQKEWNVSSDALMAGTAGWQAGLGLIVAVATEWVCYDGSDCNTVPRWFGKAFFTDADSLAYHGRTLAYIGLVCVCSVVINICAFALIGKAGPVAYEVVGHAKTIIVVIAGFLFFSVRTTQTDLIINIAGVSVALVGVALYTHFTLAAKSGDKDCIDRLCGI